MSPAVRYLVRAVLTGISAAQASLLTVAASGDGFTTRTYVTAGLLGLGGFLAYLGIGVASTNVEPAVHHNGIDNKRNDPENDQ